MCIICYTYSAYFDYLGQSTAHDCLSLLCTLGRKCLPQASISILKLKTSDLVFTVRWNFDFYFMVITKINKHKPANPQEGFS